MMDRGEDSLAVDAVASGSRSAGDACDPAELARAAIAGWFEARRLAAKGGAAELLGPVTQRITELKAITTPALAIEVEYAVIVVRAAIAAAQDERPEMELLLQQARDLSERLTQ